MGKLGKCIMALAVVVLVALGLSGRVEAANVLNSGPCGTGVSWEYYNNGKLVISGNGAIDDYQDGDSMPWSNYYDEITSVVIGEGVTRIGDFAFYYMETLEDVLLPSTLTSVGWYAFAECEALESIEIPANLTTIGSYMFFDCSSLRSVTFKGNVTKIELCAFYCCNALSSIDLPATLETIEASAFDGCKSLTGITVPAGVTYIGEGAFNYCIKVENIEVAAGNNQFISVGGVLFNKDKTRIIKYPEARKGDYTIPEGVTEIGAGAFQNAAGLSGVIIPDSVQTIEYKAFYDCVSLKEAKIPGKVKVIENNTFCNCKVLWKLELSEGVESVEAEALDECYGVKSLTLPLSLKNVHQYTFKLVPDDADVYYGGEESDWKAIKVLDDYGNVVQAVIFPYSHPTMHYTIRVKGVSLEPKTLNILPGQTSALSYKITPEDAALKDVTWKSNDERIATVDANGLVRGISPGTAIITVTTVNSSKTDTCTVNVLPQSMTLNVTKLIMQAGKESDAVKAILLNDTIAEVTSSDENVARASFSEDNIIVKAGEAGKATVTVKSGSGILQKLAVTVQKDKVRTKSISLSKTKVILKKEGGTTTVKVKASPDVISTGEPVMIKMANASKKIATAKYDENTGLVTITAKKTGTANIKVCAGDKSVYIKATVKLPVNVKKVKLNKTKIIFTKAGETRALKATITPAKADNKKVTWRSSDVKVAKVNNSGKVTAMGEGNATITVTTEDGLKKATCKVTVKLAKKKK